MLVDEKWPREFQNVVIIEIPTKNDAFMVVLKSIVEKFSLQF
jgi:hypothetical protein